MSVLPVPHEHEHIDLAEFDRLYWLLRGARARGEHAAVASTLARLFALFDDGRR